MSHQREGVAGGQKKTGGTAAPSHADLEPAGAPKAVPPPPFPAESREGKIQRKSGEPEVLAGRSVQSKGKGSGSGGYPATGPGAGRGGGAGIGAAKDFMTGAQRAFAERYAADLTRLQARPDFPADARWVDSHCHLESILARTWRGGGKPQVMQAESLVDIEQHVGLWPQGVDGCISNAAFRRPSKPGHPPEWTWLETNLAHFEVGPVADRLWFTIGIHPHDAENWDDVAERTVRRLAAHPKCVGIGECGLDFFKHDKGAAAKQLNAFRAQARLAVELGKALVVHGRLVTAENEALCMQELSELMPPGHPMHIHCYSDSLEHAKELCARWPRLRIGFTGAITFRDSPGKGGKKGKGGEVEKKGEAHCRALVQGLPLERLLIETDGPYMCPDPFRGQTAHPGHVHRVAERIAEWQGLGLGEVLAATRHSTRVVYGI